MTRRADPPRDLAPAAELAGVVAGAAAAAPDEAFRSMPPAPWRVVLEHAIAADPSGKKGVAERLGVSRPYVSRITTGHIPQASGQFVQRVVDTYMQVQCPHLDRLLPPGQCRSYAGRTYAQLNGAQEVAHWRACRRCPHNTLLRPPRDAQRNGPTQPTEDAA
ncbi:MAG: helix-turn-helix transcriptional regulator [Burkholderiaceae bacterium]|jgi:hypothetical protein|nr:helix-turn-helix transcriptional regulator [Burkholderiaceae bacterium]